MGFKTLGFNVIPFQLRVDRKSESDFFVTQPLTALRANLDQATEMPHKPAQFLLLMLT